MAAKVPSSLAVERSDSPRERFDSEQNKRQIILPGFPVFPEIAAESLSLPAGK
jgi:hypothetical protein